MFQPQFDPDKWSIHNHQDDLHPLCGHPGGIKVTTPEKLHEKKPGETLKMAVKRMLPGGVLGRKQLTKLKIYAGNEHPHSAQNPTVIELDKLNSKNIARN